MSQVWGGSHLSGENLGWAARRFPNRVRPRGRQRMGAGRRGGGRAGCSGCGGRAAGMVRSDPLRVSGGVLN